MDVHLYQKPLMALQGIEKTVARDLLAAGWAAGRGRRRMLACFEADEDRDDWLEVISGRTTVQVLPRTVGVRFLFRDAPTPSPPSPRGTTWHRPATHRSPVLQSMVGLRPADDDV